MSISFSNKTFAIAIAIFVAFVMLVTPMANVLAQPQGVGGQPDKIDICHWGDDQYNAQSVSENSITNSGQGNHANHHDGADIIPEFGDFPGQNLDNIIANGFTGQEILDNDCEIPDPDPYVFPSTNEKNKDKEVPNREGEDAPYVHQTDVGVGEVELEFVNDSNSLACFEYRIDDQDWDEQNDEFATDDQDFDAGDPHPIVIGDDVYHQICVDDRPGEDDGEESPHTVLFDAEDHVDIRLAIGGERDWDFDWTPFEVNQEPELSTLNVCKIIVDNEENVIDGGDVDAEFSINLSGPDEFATTTTFTTPLTLTDDLVDDNNDSLDAQCVSYDVPAGEYTYEEQEIDDGGAVWGPTYHDFFDETPQSIEDFLELTTDGQEGDEDNADGVINLGTEDKRTLAIVNTLEELPTEENPWCAFEGEVIEHTPNEEALENDGDEVPSERRNVSAIENGVSSAANFGGSEGSAWSTSDFFSLGINGYVIYEFTNGVALDTAGPDIAIYETTGGSADSDEKAEVFLSQNGVTYESAGVITGDGEVDISDTTLEFVKYVKLVDDSAGVQGDNGDGFDVDAIVILNESCGEEPGHTCDFDVNLLTNGGFENPVVDTNANWDVFANGESGLGWAVQWVAGLAPSHGGEDLPETALIELHNNLWTPDEGDQYTELDSDWFGPSNSSFTGEPASTEISQSVPTVDGQWYEISFAYSPRPGVAEANNVLEVHWNGDLIETISRDGSSNSDTDWSTHTYTLEATSEDTVLKLVDAGEPSDSLGPLVDDVSVMCVECEIAHTIFSDSDTQIGEGDAVELTENLPGAWASIDGAEWIWSEEINQNGSHPAGTEVFTREFEITGTPAGATLTIAADNSYSVSVNGNFICEDLTEHNYSSTDTCSIDAEDLQNGTNTITFTVENFDGSTNGNPGGLLYELVVDENQCVVPEEPEEPAESYISLPENDFDTFSQGDVPLAAFYADENGDGDDAVQWAVREGTCAIDSQYNVAGNVSGVDTPFDWEDDTFTATFDASEATPGNYCFIFNPTEDSGDDDQRLTRWFTIEGSDEGGENPQPPQGGGEDTINLQKFEDLNTNGSWDEEEQGLEWDIIVKPQTLEAEETIFVDSSDENGTTTVMSLDSGKTYLIEASGTYDWGSNSSDQADAGGYYTTNSWSSWGDWGDDNPSQDPRTLDLLIDEDETNWGSYSEQTETNHLYKAVVEGKGEPIDLRIHERISEHYDNNVGEIEVRIFEVTNDMIHTTDSEGQTEINVDPGQYQIVEVPQSGWTQTTPTGPSYCHRDTEAVESTPTCSFGNIQEEDSGSGDPVFADLTILKEVDENSIGEGGTVTYTITVTNVGPSDATGIVVEDELPSEVTLNSATPSQGAYSPSAEEWVVGNLSVGNSATLEFEVTVNSGVSGEVENTATVSGDQTDIEPEISNTDSATFTVSGVTTESSNQFSAFGSNGPISTVSFNSPGGIVAGTSTESGGEVLGDSCEPLLTSYLRRGYDNDPSEVLKLQIFLQGEVDPDPRLTAVFDEATESAVELFQMKYAEDILSPWTQFGLQPNTPTGYVYKTTRHKINALHCEDLNVPFPILP